MKEKKLCLETMTKWFIYNGLSYLNKREWKKRELMKENTIE